LPVNTANCSSSSSLAIAHLTNTAHHLNKNCFCAAGIIVSMLAKDISVSVTAPNFVAQNCGHNPAEQVGCASDLIAFIASLDHRVAIH
jgi:hypothetical protein